MTDYNFGDIVLVRFPFTDLTSSKQRPAVVISSTQYHRYRSDVVLAAITSRLLIQPPVGEFEVVGWQEAGLLKPSAVKAVLATLQLSFITKKLGSFILQDRAALSRLLRVGLGESE